MFGGSCYNDDHFLNYFNNGHIHESLHLHPSRDPGDIARPNVVGSLQLRALLGVGQVLVQLQVSGIYGFQLGEIDGDKCPDRYAPPAA